MGKHNVNAPQHSKKKLCNFNTKICISQKCAMTTHVV